MEKPIWFDETYYLNAKLNQMKESDPEYTMDQLKADLAAAGLDAYAHYDAYGDSEGLSPNLYFDRDYYMNAKLAKMKETDPNYTMEQLEAAFKAAGLTAGEHYELYGYSEGLNPSPLFDQGKYMADKLDQMQKTDPDYTMAQLEAALEEAGLSPLDHYLSYGKDEGLTPRPVVETVDFTPAVDTLVGTDGNDVFSGVIGFMPGETTINKYDSVDGGNGVDTVVVNATSDVTDLKNITTKSVEQLTINATYAAVNDNVSSWADLEGITISGATAVALEAGAKVKSLTLDGVDGAVAVTAANLASVSLSGMEAADVTLTAESATSMNVNLDDVQGDVTLTGASIATVVLNSTGGETVENNLNLESNAKTLIITGDTDLTLAADVTLVNAQSFTGDLDMDAVTVAVNANIISGSGDDSITLVDNFEGKVFGGAGDDTIKLKGGLVANAVIDGGEGFDEIELATFAGDAINAEVTLFTGAAVNNFEALTLTDGTTVKSVDFSGLDYDTVNLMAVTTDQITVKFADAEDTFGLGNPVGSSTVTAKLTFDGTDASLDLVGTVSVTIDASKNTTTLDLNLNEDTAVTASLTVKDGATINITEEVVEKAGSLTIAGVTTTEKGVTIDGSTVTAKLDITASDGADTIKGGAGDDTLAGGEGADVLYGGAGTNTFVFASNGGTVKSAADLIKGADSIMDWAEGTDNQIKFTAKNVVDKVAADNYSIEKGVVTFASSSLTLDTKVAMLADGFNTANQTVVFTDGSDSYVFQSDNTSGVSDGDILVKIAGVTDITDLNAILA